MRVLVVNAGSSSLKLRLVDGDDTIAAAADLPAPRGTADAAALEQALAGLGPADAAGHRIVHGGTFFTGPVLIDERVRSRLETLTDLAPLHQPKSLAALAAVRSALPGLPAVACFDTAFHATIPPEAATYALPREWRARWTLRRFGFHGLSHSYCSRRAAELADGARRIVTCHLGAGASLAAVLDGRSVDTTMGFTPLEGLVMATRSGSVDPGLVLWLAEHAGTPPAELAATLEHRSGLLGLAGTADMREVAARARAEADAEAGAEAGAEADGEPGAGPGAGPGRSPGDGGRGGADADARLAFGVYIHRLRAGIAAMAAALGGLDVLVFTGGVGENSAQVRAAAAAGLGFLGVRLDPAANAAGLGPAASTAGASPPPDGAGPHGTGGATRPDTTGAATRPDTTGGATGPNTTSGATRPDTTSGWSDIGDRSAPARTFVIAAREDLEIARQVRSVLGAADSAPGFSR